ncbi:MAG: hypothetical protein Q7S01_03870 [bacterium]|nr:hypothetical protein [bacterium]
MRNLLILIVAVLIIAGSMYFFARETPAPAPFEGEKSTTQYTNGQYGLSFEYPSTYVLQEKEVGNGERMHYSIVLLDREWLANIPEGGEGPPAISVDIFQNDIEQMKVEDWIRGTNFSNFKLSPDGNLSTTTVAGREAYTYRWDGLYQAESYVFSHKDNIVMFSVTFNAPEDQIRSEFS